MTCEELKEALTLQPIVVAVNADSWFDIGEDIFQYESAKWDQLNHAVLLVGFQEAQGGVPAHWIIRNSWGTEWGDKGYGKLAYGTDGNNSGICLDTSYPLA